MPSKEEKFKVFLQSLPDDKRQQLFIYLKKLSPEERNKAIDTILTRLEGGATVQSRPAPKAQPTQSAQPQTAQNRPVQPVQSAQPQARPVVPVQPTQSAQPQTAQNRPAQPVQSAQPQARPVVPVQPVQSAQPQARPVVPVQPVQPVQAPQQRQVAPVSNNQGVEFPNRVAPIRVDAVPEKTEENEETEVSQARKTNTKRDLIIVAIVLVLFIGICVGVKLFINKILDETPETSIAETSATVVSDVTAASSEETTVPTETTEITPTPTPAPTNVPLMANAPDLTGMVIVIDPGHQMETNYETENVASWLNSTKKKATCGTVGKATGVPEYELTLDIAVIMKDYLEQCGATVILTRTENDVNISNQERASVATSNNADLYIRLHADAANDSLQSGVRVFVPDSGDYSSSNSAWGDSLGQGVADSLGIGFIGTKKTSLYTGLNYANSVPSFQISLGLLSNSDDEAKLIDENNQVAISASVAEFAASFK